MDKTLRTRIIPSWIVHQYEQTEDKDKPLFTEKMVNFLTHISREDSDYIDKVKGKRGVNTRESLVNNKLNEIVGEVQLNGKRYVTVSFSNKESQLLEW